MESNENICMQNSLALLFHCLFRYCIRSFRGWLVIDINKFPYKIYTNSLLACKLRCESGAKSETFSIPNEKKNKHHLKMN